MNYLLLSFLFVIFRKTIYIQVEAKSPLLKKLYMPKSANQIIYNNILQKDGEYVVVTYGPAGTGKTCLACVNAIHKLKENKIDKIVITRPVVTVEEENIGFLPGNIERKMDPLIRPIYDIFMDFYSKKEINDLVINNKIEIAPLGFMRGRTFKNAFIIADEMQNSTPNQMLMLLTRLGINSKLVISGDLEQSDLLGKNGLYDFMTKLEKKESEHPFYLVKMNETDIQRSSIVENVLMLYKKENIKTRIINKNEKDAALIPLHDFSPNFTTL
jgi:phosphate starvation-inducible PhoH-like protein